jgi:hypothetical protein
MYLDENGGILLDSSTMRFISDSICMCPTDKVFMALTSSDLSENIVLYIETKYTDYWLSKYPNIKLNHFKCESDYIFFMSFNPPIIELNAFKTLREVYMHNLTKLNNELKFEKILEVFDVNTFIAERG